MPRLEFSYNQIFHFDFFHMFAFVCTVLIQSISEIHCCFLRFLPCSRFTIFIYKRYLSTILFSTMCFSLFFISSFSINPCLFECSRATSCWWWIWRKFCSPRELRSRTIHIGRPCEEKYPPNEIRNQVSAFHVITICFPPCAGWLFLFSV